MNCKYKEKHLVNIMNCNKTVAENIQRIFFPWKSTQKTVLWSEKTWKEMVISIHSGNYNHDIICSMLLLYTWNIEFRVIKQQIHTNT